MVLIFSHTIILSEVYQMEGFSNRIKIERMVTAKISLKKSGTEDITHTHTHVCMHESAKAKLRKTRHPLAKRAWYENASIHKKYELLVQDLLMLMGLKLLIKMTRPQNIKVKEQCFVAWSSLSKI